MPEQPSPEQPGGPEAGAALSRFGSRRVDPAAAAVSNRLLESTREVIRSVGRQLAARRANLDRMNGER